MRLWTRRVVIEALDVQATLKIENGRKVVRARCMLGGKVCDVRPAAIVV